jgi:hypothetical protein
MGAVAPHAELSSAQPSCKPLFLPLSYRLRLKLITRPVNAVTGVIGVIGFNGINRVTGVVGVTVVIDVNFSWTKDGFICLGSSLRGALCSPLGAPWQYYEICG